MKTYIVETREGGDYSTGRRRECPACGYRFTTLELPAQIRFVKQKETTDT
jgi:transcriptional regulator NrdR family protein